MHSQNGPDSVENEMEPTASVRVRLLRAYTRSKNPLRHPCPGVPVSSRPSQLYPDPLRAFRSSPEFRSSGLPAVTVASLVIFQIGFPLEFVGVPSPIQGLEPCSGIPEVVISGV